MTATGPVFYAAAAAVSAILLIGAVVGAVVGAGQGRGVTVRGVSSLAWNAFGPSAAVLLASLGSLAGGLDGLVLRVVVLGGVLLQLGGLAAGHRETEGEATADVPTTGAADGRGGPGR